MNTIELTNTYSTHFGLAGIETQAPHTFCHHKCSGLCSAARLSSYSAPTVLVPEIEGDRYPLRRALGTKSTDPHSRRTLGNRPHPESKENSLLESQLNPCSVRTYLW